MRKARRSMKKLKSYEETGILPVINVPDASLAVRIAEALRLGGVNSIEVTLRSSDSLESIKNIKTEYPDMTVGAGTVLSISDVRSAIAHGADFIVSPGYDEEVVEYCVKNGINIVPGCVTAGEIQKAVKHGLKVLKFFPAEINGGTEAIKLLSGPFPSVRFIPTGSINFEIILKNIFGRKKSSLAAVALWQPKTR
jgi:2-dehydro-3-deoxyphosphogluconate aldolase/(4S)-4-hydroxy-2-oxoglutarate aldolase